MTNLIPFDSAKLPAHVKAKGSSVNFFAAAASSGGFPSISIKGKVWHIVRGDERTLITKPDDDDEPASSIEVIIVASSQVLTKTYYEDSYKEGVDAKPTCYSDNGVGPAADAQDPQAKKCAICPHNAWGSGRDDKGNPTKGKACSDNMRLAVSSPALINDPMLLRVPPASLKALAAYGELLAKRGVSPTQVVTKLGFDHAAASPALTFKPVGIVTDEMMAEIEEAAASDVTMRIIGAKPSTVDTDTEPFEKPAPKSIKPAAKVEDDDIPAEPVKKAKKSTALAAEVHEAETTTKAKPKVKVEEDDDTPAEATKPTKKAAVVDIEDIESGLDDIDFDD